MQLSGHTSTRLLREAHSKVCIREAWREATLPRKAGPEGSYRPETPRAISRSQLLRGIPECGDEPGVGFPELPPHRSSPCGTAARAISSGASDDRGGVDPGWPRHPTAGFPFWTSGRRPPLRSPGSGRGCALSRPSPEGASSRGAARGAASRSSHTRDGRSPLPAAGRRTPGSG